MVRQFIMYGCKDAAAIQPVKINGVDKTSALGGLFYIFVLYVTFQLIVVFGLLFWVAAFF